MGKISIMKSTKAGLVVGIASIFSSACGTSLETLCNPLPEGYVPCPAERGDLCIQIYDPVCGDDGKTYSNSCEACLNREVMGYKQKACGEQ